MQRDLRGSNLFGVECGEIRGEGKHPRADLGAKKVLPARRENARSSRPPGLRYRESLRLIHVEVAE
jgi:hypothetical protein